MCHCRTRRGLSTREYLDAGDSWPWKTSGYGLHARRRIFADNASYHGSGPVRRYVEESEGQVVVDHLPAYCPDLNPDEQVWNHAKARLGKRFVATKQEFKAALLSIMRSIQPSPELLLSFFQLPDTQYAACAVC
jgi:transposase